MFFRLKMLRLNYSCNEIATQTVGFFVGFSKTLIFEILPKVSFLKVTFACHLQSRTLLTGNANLTENDKARTEIKKTTRKLLSNFTFAKNLFLKLKKSPTLQP